MVKFEGYVTREIGEFIWDGFTDAEGVGVSLEDILTGAHFVGVELTDDQIDSVIDHYTKPDKWGDEDEKIRDLIAAATDCEDYESMFAWLAFIVGDTTAEDLVKEWKN